MKAQTIDLLWVTIESWCFSPASRIILIESWEEVTCDSIRKGFSPASRIILIESSDQSTDLCFEAALLVSVPQAGLF